MEVGSSADVVAVMARGMAARATAETRMNQRSSRSHTVLTVVVDGRSALDGASTHGCLHLIDLAGNNHALNPGPLILCPEHGGTSAMRQPSMLRAAWQEQHFKHVMLGVCIFYSNTLCAQRFLKGNADCH